MYVLREIIVSNAFMYLSYVLLHHKPARGRHHVVPHHRGEDSYKSATSTSTMARDGPTTTGNAMASPVDHFSNAHGNVLDSPMPPPQRRPPPQLDRGLRTSKAKWRRHARPGVYYVQASLLVHQDTTNENLHLFIRNNNSPQLPLFHRQ